MEAQQNFIIEASRQTSIENNANLQQTNSAWTNRIEPTLLKKGDYVSVNTAIVNQKGASGANNIEFSDQYNDSTSNLQQNFTLMNVGFYLNNNNVNSIPLPYKYLHAQADRTDPTKVANNGGRKRIEYDTNPFKEVDGNQVINNKYGVARWYQIFANDYDSLSDHTADSLASFSAMNPNIKIDGKRYAKVGNSYVGWNRPDGGGNLSTEVELLTQDIPLHIEKGFKDASSVGQTLTRTLQSTQDPYSSTEVFALPKSTLATLEPNPTAQTQINPRFNGYCMKTIGANLQPYKEGILSNTEGALGNSPLYNNLCVEEPYVWEYGSRLLSNVETMRLLNNPNINDDYIGLRPHVGIDYPVLLWSTWIGTNPFDQGAIQNTSDYDFYSPHYTEAVDAGAGETGENVVRWTGFTGVMIDFNDDYGHLAEDIDDDRGVMLIKDTPTTYKFYVPQTNDFVPTDPDDGNKKLAFQAFIDNDSPSFDRILGYSPKNQIESSNWSVLGKNIIEWDFNNFLFDLGTNNPNMFQPITDATGVVADAFSINNSPVVGGTTRTNYMYNFVPYANRIIQGRKYRATFTLTQVIGADYNTFEFGLADRTSTFGFPGIVATADGTYTQEFIATADSSSVANFMFYFKNNISDYPAFLWKVEDFVIYEYDIEVGDKYVLSDIFTPTTATTSKMYKMKIDDGQLRSEKVNLENSTIFGGIFNHQYTAYAKLRAYKSGSDIIAFDGINANDYDDAVIMLYQADNIPFDYIIYNQYGSKVWRVAQITKYTGNNIQSGDTIGTIQGGNETSLKNPFRSGQQLYEYSNGNNWTYARDTPDFNAGNTWGNTLGSPLQYTATNHQPPLTLNYDIYLKDNTYSGGTASYTYSFQDTEGVTLNGNEYDSIFTIDTNTGSIYTAYLLTNRVNGLSGIYEFNNSTAGNTWTITTTGGHNGFGYIHFAGAFGTLLSPTTAWVVNNIAFNYDWDFDATPAGYTQDYLLAIDPNNLKQGTYMYFGSSNSFIAYQSIGTYTYDDATRTISFNRRGTATLQNTLITAVNPVPNLQYTTTITSHIADPLPTISAGNPVNKTLAYSHTFDVYTSLGPQTLTLYLAYNNAGDADDTDLQGKRGKLIWNNGGVWSETTWTWDGATSLILDIGGGITLTASGTTPTLTNIVQYETKQDLVIGGINYAFPSNGKQYGFSTTTLLGETTLVTDLHNPLPVSSQAIDELFLGVDMGTFNNGFNNGLVYETEAENDTNNAICSWSLTFNQTKALLIFSETITGATLLTLEEDLSNITRYGWVLIKCNKYNTGIALGNPTQTLTIQSGSGNETGNYYSNARNYALTGGNGRFITDGVHNFPHDTGTSEFLEGQNLERFNSNMPKSTLLMTNIKLTINNLEMVKDYFRYTEIYGGTIESSRKKISEDIDNFFTRLDLGRTNDDKLQVDRTEAPYVPPPYNEADKEIASVPLFNFTMRNYGAMGVDDSNADQFTDYNGVTRQGSNKNDGCIAPRMLTEAGYEQRIKVFTRWKDGYEDRVIAENRLIDRMKTGTYWERESRLYGKSITTDNFKTQYADEYNYCVSNNVGIVPYLAKDWNDINPDGSYNYVLCIGFETYEDIGLTNNTILKIQDGTFVGFSPSFLDHNYIMPMNLDMPFVAGAFNYGDSPNTLPLGFQPSIRKQDNMNHINIGSAPTITYNPDLNRFQWSYLHTPFRFNGVTGSDANIEEEVGFLNSSTLMRMEQSIGENNLVSGGEPQREDPSGNITPAVPPTSVHMGLADAQSGIFIHDLYGQTPSDTFIRNKSDGYLLTPNNYDNTLFFTLGFSYFDLKPIRFSSESFNNRFNSNTFNVISGDFKKLGTSPFTTNSAIDVGDQIKTNIFTDGYLTRTYSHESPYGELPDPNSNGGANGFAKGGTPAFYLGYNNLLSTSIKTSSGLMTSRSVIVNLTAPFYRIYCNLPLDTLAYLANGSLSCAGYMTKNYQSQSFIYSFASDYGGYLTRDVLITDLRTEIRDPRGLLVNSIDSNSAVFYKITRQIALESGLTPKQEKEQAELLLERQQQEAEEASEIRAVSMNVIKYFKTLFTQTGGGGANNRELTANLGEPSGIEEVYQQLAMETPIKGKDFDPDVSIRDIQAQQRGIESKEPYTPFLKLEPKQEPKLEPKQEPIDLTYDELISMGETQADERYTTNEHRLLGEMGRLIYDAINERYAGMSGADEDKIRKLHGEIKNIGISGEVLTNLAHDISRITDRSGLRKLVEKTIGQSREYTTIAERKKRATKVMAFLTEAQDVALFFNPKLKGTTQLPLRKGGVEKSPYIGKGREVKFLTEKERELEERKKMGGEDRRERRGRKSARRKELIRREGAYASPLRQKGRRILEERERSGRGRELFKDNSGGASK